MVEGFLNRIVGPSYLVCILTSTRLLSGILLVSTSPLQLCERSEDEAEECSEGKGGRDWGSGDKLRLLTMRESGFYTIVDSI